jgi:ribose 5-phosphate isomerase RpiB
MIDEEEGSGSQRRVANHKINLAPGFIRGLNGKQFSNHAMPTPEDQLEQIVQAVMQRLSSIGPTEPTPPQGEADPATQKCELTLNEKVINAATLENRLDGVQRVVVAARAVVTPAARDILQENNITLVRSLQAVTPAPVQLVIASSDQRIGSEISAIDLIGRLQQRGLQVEKLTGDDLGNVTSDLAEAVSHGNKLGVLLTDQVAAALCVANRRSGVRATGAGNRGEVNDVVQNLGANLLVVDTSRRSKQEVQRMVETFVTTPAHSCPTELKKWLE